MALASLPPAGSGLDAVRSQHKEKNSQPPVAVEGVGWSSKVQVPGAYMQRGSTIEATEARGIKLEQILEFWELVKKVMCVSPLQCVRTGDPISPDDANLYHLDAHFVSPLTLRFKCSFVELIASGPQLPRWFVSHWWGTPFYQTVSMLSFHRSQRQLLDDSASWVCTFANNQHDLANLAGELCETPFVKVILAPQCEGTVALLDQKVTTFRRIWCVLENFVSTSLTREQSKPNGHLYDTAAWLAAGVGTFGGKPVPPKPTLRLDLGGGQMKEVVEDEQTGGAFPLQVSAIGATINIYKAQASRAEDKNNILHLIAGTSPADRIENPPPTTCDAYDKLNAGVRHMFVGGALYRAAVQNDCGELERLLVEFPDSKNEGISDGATATYAAAWKNHLKPLQVLINARADLEKAKDDGATPVFVAAQVGHREALDLLLEARADPSKARSSGDVSPAFIAIQNGHTAILRALLQYRADPNGATSRGNTLMHLAVQQDRKKCVEMLIDIKADVNMQNSASETPLAVASKSRKQDLVKMLRNAGAKVEKVDDTKVSDSVDIANTPASAPGAKAKARAKSKAKAKASFGSAMVGLDSHLDFYGELEGLARGADAVVEPRPRRRRA